MDPTTDGTVEDARLIEIRTEIDAARTRLAETIDALAYKVDVPSRFGDVLASTASSLTARVLDRLPSRAGEPTEEAPAVDLETRLRE